MLTRAFSVLLIPPVLTMAMTAGPLRSELTVEERVAWLEGFRPLVDPCGDMGMPDGYARLRRIQSRCPSP